MSSSSGDGVAPDIHPSEQILQHLAGARQWERLLQMARMRLERLPDDHTAHRAAALALIRLRRAGEAEAHVAHLLREDPEHDYHHELAALVAMQNGNFRKAHDHLRAGLALDPDKAGLHRLMASIQGVLGNSAEAHLHASRAHELGGDTEYSWLVQEVVWEADFKDPASMAARIQSLEKALEQAPENAFLLWRVGRLLLRMEQPAAALIWLGKAVAADPFNKAAVEDWREAFEKKNGVYRALSFPWRSWKDAQAVFRATRLRPDILRLVVMVALVWLLLLPWWLLSWICLAPLGGLVRYFMLLHPAFDFYWLSRQWLYGRSQAVRAALMIGTLGVMLAGGCLLLPWQYPVGWLAVAALQLLLQMHLHQESVRTRKKKWPRLPSSWLDAT